MRLHLLVRNKVKKRLVEKLHNDFDWTLYELRLNNRFLWSIIASLMRFLTLSLPTLSFKSQTSAIIWLVIKATILLLKLYNHCLEKLIYVALTTLILTRALSIVFCNAKCKQKWALKFVCQMGNSFRWKSGIQKLFSSCRCRTAATCKLKTIYF